MDRLRAYAAEALDAIRSHRMRSILTVLGMAVGTSSIIAVFGLSSAAQGGISQTLASFGDPGVYVTPDPNQDELNWAQIKYADLNRLREATANQIDEIVPNWDRTYAFRANGVTYLSRLSSQSGVVRDRLQLLAGRRISVADVDDAARVALFSPTLAARFFPSGDAVGRVIRIGGVRFIIIGVYDWKTSSLFSAIAGQDYAEVPPTTYHLMAPDPVGTLLVYARPGVDVATAGDAVVGELRRIHGRNAKYSVQDPQAFIEGFSKVISALGAGLSAIGAVALIVAGVGIMNIMLVSVTERTREIGIRKAIGASRRDITLQFLIEAVLLAAVGGAIGTVAGLIFVLLGNSLIESYIGAASVPYVPIVGLAVGISSLVGLIFGAYPAMRAGKLDPIAALRS